MGATLPASLLGVGGEQRIANMPETSHMPFVVPVGGVSFVYLPSLFPFSHKFLLSLYLTIEGEATRLLSVALNGG